jgi:tryptophan 2,3-dioxygenase
MNDRPRKRMNLLKVARSAFEMAGVHATFKAIPEEEVSFHNVEGEPFCNSRGTTGKKGDDDEDSDSEDERNEEPDSDDDATDAQEGDDDGPKIKRSRMEKDSSDSEEGPEDAQLRRVVNLSRNYLASEHEESAFAMSVLDLAMTAEEENEQNSSLAALEHEQSEVIAEIDMLLSDAGNNANIANLAPRLQKLQSSLHSMRAERQRLLQKLYYRMKVEKKLSETIMQLKVELHETRAGRIDWSKKEPVLFNKSITPAFESFYQEHPLTTQHVRDIARSVLVAISQCIGSYRLPKVRADSKIKGSRRERLLSKLRHGLTDALSILERSDPSMFAAFTHRLHNAAAAQAAAAAANGLPLPLGVEADDILSMSAEEAAAAVAAASGGMDMEAGGGLSAVDPLSLAARGGRGRPPMRGPNPLMLSAMEAATVGSATMPSAEANLLVGNDASRRGRRVGAGGRSGRDAGGVNNASLPVDASGLPGHFFVNDPMMAMANAAQQAQRGSYHMAMNTEDDSEDER